MVKLRFERLRSLGVWSANPSKMAEVVCAHNFSQHGAKPTLQVTVSVRQRSHTLTDVASLAVAGGSAEPTPADGLNDLVSLEPQLFPITTLIDKGHTSEK